MDNPPNVYPPNINTIVLEEFAVEKQGAGLNLQVGKYYYMRVDDIVYFVEITDIDTDNTDIYIDIVKKKANINNANKAWKDPPPGAETVVVSFSQLRGSGSPQAPYRFFIQGQIGGGRRRSVSKRGRDTKRRAGKRVTKSKRSTRSRKN